jgi:gliding motility-associated lipoprotein GldH
MRSVTGFLLVSVFLFSCDERRVFEKNADFDSRYWLVTDKPEFEFEITDTLQRYNIYGNIRNSVSYPYARIFLTYSLRDSTGTELEKKLVSKLLFDDKTGEPHGNSGLGDIYDHRLPLKRNYQFSKPGKYSVRFEQFMRTDTLSGVLAVGLRVERYTTEP